jgi:hypothetical protein
MQNKIYIFESINEILNSTKKLNKIQNLISRGQIIIVKSVIKKKKINEIKEYLKIIGGNSLPRYHIVDKNTPNHHRIVVNDPRSYVKATFHQFSFFNWNQDVLDLFSNFKKLFWLKNLLSGNKKNQYLSLSSASKYGAVSRISFQFYPCGKGYMNRHKDPVGKHQISAPLLIMSDKSKNGDFNNGGTYLIGKNNKKIYLEDKTEIGDLIMYDATLPHGVDIIDKNKKKKWNEFEGRWVGVIATNKIHGNDAISNAEDLEG